MNSSQQYPCPALKFELKRNANIYPHEESYINGQSGITCNSQKLDTIQISIAWGVDKQNVVQPYNGTLLSNKKPHTTDALKVGRTSKVK